MATTLIPLSGDNVFIVPPYIQWSDLNAPPPPVIGGLQYNVEFATVYIPQIREGSEYGEFEKYWEKIQVSRLYCRQQSKDASDVGTGTKENPVNDFYKAADFLHCLSRRICVDAVQIIILPGGDLPDIGYLKQYMYDGNWIVGDLEASDKVTVQCSADLYADTQGFSVLANLTVNVQVASITLPILCGCEIDAPKTSVTTVGYKFDTSIIDSQVQCKHLTCGNRMWGASVRTEGCASLNCICNSNIHIAPQYFSSFSCKHIYAGTLTLSGYVGDRFGNQIISDTIKSSSITGAEVTCYQLLVDSVITCNYEDRLQSGANIWGVSGHGEYIVDMGKNAVVKNSKVIGKNKIMFTGSGRGYYGIIAVITGEGSAISELTVDLRTSAVDIAANSNTHWSIVSYTCAHAVWDTGLTATCKLGCDYKLVEIQPEEDFSWATPCKKMII